MTCRHSDPINNPNCGSYRTPAEQIKNLKKQIEGVSDRFKESIEPDNSKFEIIDCFEMAQGLILKVRYESCAGCSYEGTKVLVYRGAAMKDVLNWRVIDPHFSDKPAGGRMAPSPTARFPASPEGERNAALFLATLDREASQ